MTTVCKYMSDKKHGHFVYEFIDIGTLQLNSFFPFIAVARWPTGGEYHQEVVCPDLTPKSTVLELSIADENFKVIIYNVLCH